ncbi:hypothetical protein J5N97_028532 [Dioscorea zingiberensis]|uniref:Serpin domain-containing protein n=1 Tax=Dioscorea zingiberensis TaxID=325984 RepID=A0A9D5BZ49_9LILI|nr:hypothetical protein J5N97_028532 [Dioscorea zingiberensis]
MFLGGCLDDDVGFILFLQADEVAKEVNSWVDNMTSGLIKELLPSGSIDHNTRLVFGNALYFKGAWDKKFDATKTTDSEFHLLNGSSVQVPFMASKEKQFLSAHDGFKVLGLPYKKEIAYLWFHCNLSSSTSLVSKLNIHLACSYGASYGECPIARLVTKSYWLQYDSNTNDQVSLLMYQCMACGGVLSLTWYNSDYVDLLPMTSMQLCPNQQLGYPGRTYKFYDGPVQYSFGHDLS